MATSYVLFIDHNQDTLSVATRAAFKLHFEPLDNIEYLTESEDVHYLCGLADTTKVFCNSLPPEIAEQFD